MLGLRARKNFAIVDGSTYITRRRIFIFRSKFPMGRASDLYIFIFKQAVGTSFQGRGANAKHSSLRYMQITVEIEECVDESVQLRTLKKYEKLEDIYRIPDAGGVSTYANTGTFLSRPTTVTTSSSGGADSRPVTSILCKSFM